MKTLLRLAIVFGMVTLVVFSTGCRDKNKNINAKEATAADSAGYAEGNGVYASASTTGTQSNSPINSPIYYEQTSRRPYSDNSGSKNLGAAPPPPFDVDPEDPPSGSEVTINIDIEGATGIVFTAEGSGCGTIPRSASSDNHLLSIDGLADKRGYCDMIASATGGVVQSYGGRFEVDATDPHLPPLELVDGFWDEEKLPEADKSPPVITGIDEPSGGIPPGGSATYTLHFENDEEIAGIYLYVDDHPHGLFYAPASGADGESRFVVEANEEAKPGFHKVTLVMVDTLDRKSEPFDWQLVVGTPLFNAMAFDVAVDTLSVAGQIKYQKFTFVKDKKALDKPQGSMQPVRFATVEAISSKDYKTVLGKATTGEDGKYKITFRNSTNAPSYFVRVSAASDKLQQQVMKSPANKDVYTYTSSAVSTSVPEQTNLNLEIKEADGAGAFNIWDVTVSANAYAKKFTGSAPPKLDIYWPSIKDGDTWGSWFSNDNPGQIHISGCTKCEYDPDEWDGTVIAHEYGHFVMAKFSTDDSPGGNHQVHVRSEPRLALSEGWATFFAGAALSLDYYYDTDDDGKVKSPDSKKSSGTLYSIETLCEKGEECDKKDGSLTFELDTSDQTLEGNICESAVTAVLWDYFDDTQETQDTLKNKSESIWSVMTKYLKARKVGDGVKYCDRGFEGRDLVDFLDGWQWLNLGSGELEGLKGATIGLMKLPNEFVLPKESLWPCK